MEKWEIRPPLPQQLLNRSSPKFAWVITLGTPTLKQNFITIQLPLFAPQICENAHHHISGTVGARNVKFGMQIHHQGY